MTSHHNNRQSKGMGEGGQRTTFVSWQGCKIISRVLVTEGHSDGITFLKFCHVGQDGWMLWVGASWSPPPGGGYLCRCPLPMILLPAARLPLPTQVKSKLPMCPGCLTRFCLFEFFCPLEYFFLSEQQLQTAIYETE